MDESFNKRAARYHLYLYCNLFHPGSWLAKQHVNQQSLNPSSPNLLTVKLHKFLVFKLFHSL